MHKYNNTAIYIVPLSAQINYSYFSALDYLTIYVSYNEKSSKPNS